MSITNVQFDEYFGFTDSEVKEMLNYYGLMDHFDSMKAWYDGYRFGNEDVYCPWDVLSHCDNLRTDPNARPEDYWSNTSGNAIVRRFIDLANGKTRDEIERLIAGETIQKEIRQELTYSELDNSIENLWSVLFTTGYLTQRGMAEGDKYYHLQFQIMRLRSCLYARFGNGFATRQEVTAKLLTDFVMLFQRAMEH